MSLLVGHTTTVFQWQPIGRFLFYFFIFTINCEERNPEELLGSLKKMFFGVQPSSSWPWAKGKN
jgi:hypothetical protein